MNLKSVITLFSLFGLATMASAQVNDSLKVQKLEEVIVTANKSEQKILKFQWQLPLFPQNRSQTHVW
jgi:hypothetical protein